jgi:hypothetical protein
MKRPPPLLSRSWFAPSTPLRASNHDLSCGSAVYWLRSLVVAKQLIRRSRNFAGQSAAVPIGNRPCSHRPTVRGTHLAETIATDVDGNVVATPCQTYRIA